MSTVTATSSPSSLQLRLGFRCRRKSPTVLVRTRVKKLDRQIRLFCVASDGEQNRNETSWVGLESNGDSVFGWSGSDNGVESLGPRRNKWYQGMVGAGVAGFILVSGLTFAALSLSKASNNRPKQQMEPLTAELEVFSNEEDDGDGHDGNNKKQEDCSLERKTGTENNSSSFQEFVEDSSEKGLDNDTDVGTSSIHDVEYASNGIKNDYFQEDVQNVSALDDEPVAPDTTTISSKLHESETVGDPFIASPYTSLGTDKPESTLKLEENPVKAEPSNSLVSEPSLINLKTNLQEGTPSSFAHGLSEQMVEVTSVSELDITVEPGIALKDGLETVATLATKENLDLVQIKDSAETNNYPLKVYNLSESVSATSVSVSAYPFANEQDTNHHNEMNRSSSLIESLNPGNSFSSAGIPAPSVVSAALQVLPGKVLIPAIVDQVQGQALAALQVLKVIEADVQPSDLCSRREYARWLVSASSTLSRNTVSKVYPAMYIENVTELAFDDITPEDPDFACIQGLAEAGLIASKLSRRDMNSSLDEDRSPFYFCPESPLSRQDLVSWKMAIEKRQLPEVDRKTLYQLAGFIDIDKVNPDAYPALAADLYAGEQGIIALAFGFTRLFQPDKPVTKAQAAVALATGEASDMVSEELARIEAESMAENAVAAHSALVAQVEKDINASFEKELSIEREKIDAMEKMAEEARCELERLRAGGVEDNIALMKERAAIESEMEVMSKLRHEVEEQLQSLMSNKVEIAYEKERISKLRKEAEDENREIARLQYELEVERKALSIARAWAEDEAKRAREQAKALEEARNRWERHGIRVVVDSDLLEETSPGVSWLNAGKQFSVDQTVSRAENLVDKLKVMAADVRGKSRDTINKIIEKLFVFISKFKEWACEAGRSTKQIRDTAISKAAISAQELQQSSIEFSSALKEGARRVAGDCREGVGKLTQKFKT